MVAEIDMKRIGLVTSGGVAPGINATIRAVTRLAHSEGFEVFAHSIVPANDGGICLGQAVVAAQRA